MIDTDRYEGAGQSDCRLKHACNRAVVDHAPAMIGIIRLDRRNRVVLSRELRRVAGVASGQKFRVTAIPGRIVFEVQSAMRGEVVKRGKLKVWTGKVPIIPLKKAVERTRVILNER